jgi:magnesium transporter
MTERAEKTNDVLGKLTVLGTIVLPMSFVTGLFGMNVEVPGQFVEGVTWFWALTGGLCVGGLFCFLLAKRLYGVV